MIRLNRYLADCGVCARRKADALIAAGKVTVGGRPARLGQIVDPQRDVVAVDGARVEPRTTAHLTLVLHKPAGVVTTMRDERGRPAVARYLKADPRLVPVGRLDAATTGVLLCTTDGDLAHALAHPRFGVEKRYRVRVAGDIGGATIAALGATAVRRARDGSTTFDVVLREGANRQVRRMCAGQGLRVLELERIAFGPVALRGLAPGAVRVLTPAERGALERLRLRAHGAQFQRPAQEGRPFDPQNEGRTTWRFGASAARSRQPRTKGRPS